ncbi:response regulator [Verrucomicrobium spinosum]|uniref:response regulator n=1 Tax=Verrucomicrobium spinosum TaxID=2736 RepID=UPI0001744DFC|nr:response regulator transcription factor [Verrucomicrobium spinosum]
MPEPDARARVLLIDNDTGFRTDLGQRINVLANVRVCGEAGDAATGLEAVRSLTPELAIVEVNLPDRNGISLIPEITSVSPLTVVLVLTAHDEVFFGLEALRAGAYGYLVKDDIATYLQMAVTQTLRREYFLPPRLVAHLLHGLEHPERFASFNPNPLSTLTDREMEVFQWLSRGYGTKRIAERLGLGIKTIETHRANIMARLDLHTAEELVNFAVEWRERVLTS